MGGPAKNSSRRQREPPHGPSSTSSAQSSSGQSTTSSARESVKTASSGGKTVVSARYDGAHDGVNKPTPDPRLIGMKNLESLGMAMWKGFLGVS
jgi:hypothetical protein